MALWKKYRESVEKNVASDSLPIVRGVNFWRDRLFTVILVYTLPVGMIAYVPAMVACYYFSVPEIAFFDTLAVVLLAIATFRKRLSIKSRKLIFIITMYLLSVSLLYYMGVYGPGLLYLLSTIIFVSLIYSSRLAYICIVVNTIICVLFSLSLRYGIVNTEMATLYTPETWLAVASNLVLLGVLFAAAIQMLTSGFMDTLQTEGELKNKLVLEGIESQKLVKELRLKNEELEQFTYIASHDLQEPLNTISGIVEVLKMDHTTRDDDDFKMSLGFISYSVDRLRGLIKGLLDYARIGRQLELETVDCKAMLDQVIGDLKASISESGARVIIDASVEQLLPFKVNPLDFRQLFQNLLSNAIKFRRDDVAPEIKVSVQRKEDFLQFRVTDNGIGIQKGSLENIFVIFKRGHTNKKYSGTGIGLAFCKKIVDLHGGRIWVESEPGKGSRFFFTIRADVDQQAENE